MATQTNFDTMGDSFRHAAENFTKTLQAGVKFQEETAQLLRDAMSRNAEGMQAQFEKMTQDATPLVRKNLERFHRMFDEQSTRAMELLKQSMETGTARTPADAYERLAGLWRQSFDTMRESVDSITRAQSEALEAWNEIVRTAPSARTGENGHSNGHGKSRGGRGK